MAAYVESMFYTSNEKNGRFVPWHGLGTPVLEAPTSEEALKLAGLDWKVERRKTYAETADQEKIREYFLSLGMSEYIASTAIKQIKGNSVAALCSEKAFTNVRDKDETVLGAVGDRYKIVQNADAFAFTDNLIGTGTVRYETAGSLRDGKQIWLLAQMPTTEIGGDEVAPFICFTNTHDGSGSVKACMTPIRVVCNNTLNAALKGATRVWKTRHTTNVQSRMDEARTVLGIAQNYMVELADYAEAAIKTRIDDREVDYIIRTIFDPKPTIDHKTGMLKQPSRAQIEHADKKKKAFLACYDADDITKFKGTAWGVVNAMSDLVGHSMPGRETKTKMENRWENIIEGDAVFDKLVAALCVK